MSLRFHSLVALAIATTTLTGCGAKGLVPATPVNMGGSIAAQAKITAVDPKVTKLIADYQAITAQDAAAIAAKDAIVAELGKTDNTNAVTFLLAEYDKAKALPDDLRTLHQQAIAQALATLDTYDASIDDKTVAAGPGKTEVSAQEYDLAATRKARHGSIMHFLTSPLRWADGALRWLDRALNGKPHRNGSGGGGGHKPPAPGPGPAPGPAPAPAGAPGGAPGGGAPGGGAPGV